MNLETIKPAKSQKTIAIEYLEEIDDFEFE